jgi:hypothetical protein
VSQGWPIRIRTQLYSQKVAIQDIMSSALTLYDASAPLLSRRFTGASPSFPQSGGWNWVGLLDSGVKGAVKVLSRYSAAGIDPHTLVVGQIACSGFRLTARSEARLRHAIMDLKSMSTIGNMLHIGFGIDSVVRNLATTEEGGILVALCAAAAEAFVEDHAASVLWELVRTFKVPEKQTPALLQWKALLRVCAGVLAETEFPALADHFMNLYDENNQLAVETDDIWTLREARTVSSPDSMAEALVAIGKVAVGELVAISIVGGADAGWLAAVAQWLFDLRIAIFDSDGELLHATAAHEGQPQVRFFFVKRSVNEKVTVQGPVYNLRDITGLLSIDKDLFESGLVCSRVPWAQALSLVFGREFKRLAEMPRSLGSALASAGRIFDGICKAEPFVLTAEKLYCQTYFNDGRGRGFLSFACALFPELGEALKSSTDPNAFDSFISAFQAYDSSIAHIKLICGCDFCVTGDERGLRGYFNDKSCLLLLLETIIVMVQSMSGISAPPTLYPMRSGIEAFYRRQFKLHLFKELQSRMDAYGPIGAVLEFNTDVCEEWNIEESVGARRVIDAARLFSGRNIDSISHEKVAIGVSGIVAFLNILVDGGLSVNPELIGGCTVMSGHIEMHGRPYTHLEDLSDYDLVGMDCRKGQDGKGLGPDPLLDPSTLSDAYTRVSLIAKEGVESVNVGLSFHESHGERPVVIGPSSLAEHVLQATGLVECNRQRCSHDPVEFQREIGECVKLVATQGQCEIGLFQGSTMGRMVALTRLLKVQPRVYKILQHDECLQCCIKAAELSEYKKAIIISKRQSQSSKRKSLAS